MMKNISIFMLFFVFMTNIMASDTPQEPKKEYEPKTVIQLMSSFYKTTGINAILNPSDDVMTSEPKKEDMRVMTNFEQTWGVAST